MMFTDPGHVEVIIERDEVLRTIRDRVGYRTLLISTGSQIVIGAVLLFTDRAGEVGTWLFTAGVCSILLLSIVEWRTGIRAAAKESIRDRSA